MKNTEFRRAIAERQYQITKSKLDEGLGDWVDWIQDKADWASIGLGAIPGLNLAASGIDYLSAGIDALQGQYKDAGWRAASGTIGLVPFGKVASGVAKAAKGFGKAGVAAAETAAKAVRGAAKAEKPLEVVTRRIPGSAGQAAEAGVETAAKTAEAGVETAAKTTTPSTPKQLEQLNVITNSQGKVISSRPVTGLQSTYRGEVVNRYVEPLRSTQTATREIATATKPTINFPIVKAETSATALATRPMAKTSTEIATKTASKDLTDLYAKALTKAETRAATKTATKTATELATKTATKLATKIQTPLKTALKAATKLKNQKEYISTPTPGSQGVGDDVSLYGYGKTKFGRAPAAVLLQPTSDDSISSKPRKTSIDDSYNPMFSEARETPKAESPVPFEGQGTQARMQEPMLSTSIVKSGPNSTRARRMAMMERIRKTLSVPGIPSPEHKISDIDPKYANMPINVKSLQIPATKKILRKKN